MSGGANETAMPGRRGTSSASPKNGAVLVGNGVPCLVSAAAPATPVSVARKAAAHSTRGNAARAPGRGGAPVPDIYDDGAAQLLRTAQ